MAGQLLLINPKKRKAKRAAPKKRAKRRVSHARRAAPVVVMANPKRRRSRLSALRTKAKRVGRKYKRNPSSRITVNSITTMAKGAAIGAVGALAVDVAFGYAKDMLPTSMQTPVDATGSLNPLYFAGKGAMAVLIGVVGAKVTKHAGAMAAGSLTVSAYEMLRTFVPASVTLGNYVSPAMPVRRLPPSANMSTSMNRFVTGTGSSMRGYTAPSNKLYMGEFVS